MPPQPTAPVRLIMVTDSHGQRAHEYSNVTRSEAKQLWSKDTGRPYFEARTAKIDD